MPVKVHIYKNTFRDSVYLMRLSTTIRQSDGVTGAEVIVGTDHNKEFLRTSGLWTEEIEREARSNDLIVVVNAITEQAAESAMTKALAELDKGVEQGALAGEYVPQAFDSALRIMPEANLALISIPGQHVWREANRILEAGLHVMIFSDNVPIEAEVALKKKGLEKGLLVMGPDCGTAIIKGTPLAFANDVRTGGIGIVAASGTGIQEVSTLVHNLGEGISHAIGTGGRDLKGAVGGVTMLQGLEALMEDAPTRVIVVVSKPPEAEVALKVLEVAARSPKPVVVNFIGGNPEEVRSFGCEPALTLKEAATKAVRVLRGETCHIEEAPAYIREQVRVEKQKYRKHQRFLRGLFSGGTLAYEAMILLQKGLGGIYSNVALDPQYALTNVYHSRGHSVIDFGDDEFTQGRLHPMIDPTLRNQRIITEAKDPETAVIMIDLVLGYNAHPDPAGAALEAIDQAREIAGGKGQHITFVASVCGTDDDPQNRLEQVEKLTRQKVLVSPSNADAALFVEALLSCEE